MLKFIVIGVALFLLFKMFKGDAKFKSKREEKNTENLKATGDMVKDPICGTYVDKDATIRVRNGETVHCFCSYDCRDKYVKQLESGAAEKEEVE